jgi:predicted tellurium resistance membrane protein TerC
VVLIFFALTLLSIPYLKLAGAALLVWIGVKLLARTTRTSTARSKAATSSGGGQDRHRGRPGDERGQRHRHRRCRPGRGRPHQMPLVIFGLLVSIPIIVGGSQLVIKLMDRFPLVITLGGMLLGWIAGSMAVTDPALLHLLPTQPASHAGATVEVIPAVHYAAAAIGAFWCC